MTRACKRCIGSLGTKVTLGRPERNKKEDKLVAKSNKIHGFQQHFVRFYYKENANIENDEKGTLF